VGVDVLRGGALIHDGPTRSLAIGSYAARAPAVDDITLIEAMRREHALAPLEAMLIGRHPSSWWRRRFGLIESALVASLLDELGCRRPSRRDERRIRRALRRADLSLVLVADDGLRQSIKRVRTGARRWLHVEVDLAGREHARAARCEAAGAAKQPRRSQRLNATSD
jgi:hypothetical protein